MKIDRYEIQYNPAIREQEYYAVAGKKKIPMPAAFSDMYTDDYLEISEVKNLMPEVYGIPYDKDENGDDLDYAIYYVPRRTA